MADKLIHMGTLARPHGLRGEIAINWFAASPLSCDAPYWLQIGGDAPRAVRVLRIRNHQGRPLISLEGIADRSEAELLRGGKLLMNRKDLPEPEEGEAYLDDLLGGDVLLPDNMRLGRLDSVFCQSAQEIWVIVTDTGQEILFPAVPEFILNLDTAARAVTIAPPDGLLDIYLRP